ncbi:hypothetical protein H7C19_34055 [Cohnella nanjingensis]|uniref:Uncharacterized protein n=1 Tax=Cohnella nanjingensis TaxID=1387779 RepID=A0A7X0VJL0_9BACL|nr:hypothetical protein [Cohnella nanjingensis]MBB6675698.1 hypothetical protein [Cohnella nanjingensis]
MPAPGTVYLVSDASVLYSVVPSAKGKRQIFEPQLSAPSMTPSVSVHRYAVVPEGSTPIDTPWPNPLSAI